jgi:hypothetical protein
MPVSTGAPRKIRWQGVVPGRGSDLKLVSIGRAGCAVGSGTAGPCERSESEEVESGSWPIDVAVAKAQRLLELAVAPHSPHGADELRASV